MEKKNHERESKLCIHVKACLFPNIICSFQDKNLHYKMNINNWINLLVKQLLIEVGYRTQSSEQKKAERLYSIKNKLIDSKFSNIFGKILSTRTLKISDVFLSVFLLKTRLSVSLILRQDI